MSGWIKTDRGFSAHTLLLLVPRTDAVNNGVEAKLDASPDELETYWRGLIEAARPELESCVIAYMDFDPNRRMWRVLVEHPSLPPTSIYSEARQEPLFKEDKAESLEGWHP